MAFGPNTSWQIEEEKVEGVTNFIFLGSKITADGDGSHEIKKKKKKHDCSLEGQGLCLTNLGYQKAETSLCHQRSI